MRHQGPGVLEDPRGEEVKTRVYKQRMSLAVLGILVGTLLMASPCESAGHTRARLAGPKPPPAWMDVVVSPTQEPDTITVEVLVGFDEPCEQWTGAWSITLPKDVVLISGPAGGLGSTSSIRGVHRLRIKPLRSGTFLLRGTFRTALDSLNWTSHEFVGELRIAPDSLVYKRHPLPYGIANQKHVMAGVHHRRFWPRGTWLPLDPGETEEVEPGLDERLFRSPPPASKKAFGVAGGASTDDSTVFVPVLVAVDRNGNVKDVYTHMRVVPRPMLDAAVEAAREWAFPPAESYGMPVSALYEIQVPVLVPRRK